MKTRTDAEAIIKLMQRGQVLACTLTYANDYAERHANRLLREMEQFDGAIIAPFVDGQEVQSHRLGKTARREMKKAYKEGLVR